MSPTPLVHGVDTRSRVRVIALLNKISIYMMFVLPLFLVACNEEVPTNARMTGKDETPLGAADVDTQMRQDREKRDFDEKQAEAARKAQEDKDKRDREFREKELGVNKELKLEELKVRSKEADNSADLRGGEQKGNVEARKYEADARVTQAQIQAEAQRDAASGQMWGSAFQAGAGLAGSVGGAAMNASGARDAAEAQADATKYSVDANKEARLAEAQARTDQVRFQVLGDKAAKSFAADLRRHSGAMAEVDRRLERNSTYVGHLTDAASSGRVILGAGTPNSDKARIQDFARRNGLEYETQPLDGGGQQIIFKDKDKVGKAVNGGTNFWGNPDLDKPGELARVEQLNRALTDKKAELKERSKQLAAYAGEEEGVDSDPQSLLGDLPPDPFSDEPASKKQRGDTIKIETNTGSYSIPSFFAPSTQEIVLATAEVGKDGRLKAKEPLQKALNLDKLPNGSARVMVMGGQKVENGELVNRPLDDAYVKQLTGMGLGTIREVDGVASINVPGELKLDQGVGEAVGKVILENQDLRAISNKSGSMTPAEMQAFGQEVDSRVAQGMTRGAAVLVVAKEWQGPLSCGPLAVACSVSLSEKMGKDGYQFEVIDQQIIGKDGTSVLHQSVKVTNKDGNSFLFNPDKIPDNANVADWVSANVNSVTKDMQPDANDAAINVGGGDTQTGRVQYDNLRSSEPSSDSNPSAPKNYVELPKENDSALGQLSAGGGEKSGDGKNSDWKGVPFAAPSDGSDDSSLSNLLSLAPGAGAGSAAAAVSAAGVGSEATAAPGAALSASQTDAAVDGLASAASVASAAAYENDPSFVGPPSPRAGAAASAVASGGGASAAAAASASVEVNNFGFPIFTTPPLLAAPSAAPAAKTTPSPDSSTNVPDLLRRAYDMDRAEREAKYACVGGYENDECAGFQAYAAKLDEIRQEGESLKSLRAEVEEIRKKNNRTPEEEQKIKSYQTSLAALNTKIDELNELREKVSIVGSNQTSIQNTQDLLADSQMSVGLLLDALGENYNASVANQELSILGERISVLRNQDIITNGSDLYAQNQSYGPGVAGDGPSSDLRGGSSNAAAFR